MQLVFQFEMEKFQKRIAAVELSHPTKAVQNFIAIGDFELRKNGATCKSTVFTDCTDIDSV